MVSKGWLYNNKQVLNIADMPSDTIGFVYKITDANGKMYIGRKSIFSKRKRHFGKKEAALVKDKRLKKWEYVTTETNWLTYTGSCKPLNAAIKKGLSVKKEILKFCSNSKQLTFYEWKFQFCNDVIESNNHLYWNENICGKFFPEDLK